MQRKKNLELLEPTLELSKGQIVVHILKLIANEECVFMMKKSQSDTDDRF